jgi:hypothetical protein
MPAGIKHRSERKNQPMTDRVWDAGRNKTSKRKSTNQKAWRKKPANDRPCLGCRRESNIEAEINQSERLAGKPAND